MNQKSKNTAKNRWDFIGIFTCDYKCVCVWMRVWGVIVGYYCVCMCDRYIVHAYVKYMRSALFLLDLSRQCTLCCYITVGKDFFLFLYV